MAQPAMRINAFRGGSGRSEGVFDDLHRAGAIHARLLRPGQARILLAALLAGKSSAAEISAAFAAPCDAADSCRKGCTSSIFSP